MRELLPIGSVVKLKEEEQLFMIYGRFFENKNTKKIYDYLACMYPEGRLDSKINFAFNDSDIEEVYFIGFKNELELEMKKDLKELFSLGR